MSAETFGYLMLATILGLQGWACYRIVREGDWELMRRKAREEADRERERL
jgi:hypothetical protein